MKRATSFGLALTFIVFLMSCAPAASIKAGSATAESLLKLLPKTTMGFLTIDVHRAVGTPQTAKMLENPQAKEKYDEFVKMAGIDPLKDIYFVVMGYQAKPDMAGQDMGAIVNLNYERENLLAIMKDKAPAFQSESYNGVTIYSNLDGTETKQTTRAAFLDDSNILFGTEAGVKGIVDVYQKKAESIMKNKDMGDVIKSVDKAAITWGALTIPPELMKKGIEAMPQLKVLEGVKALTMSFDVRLSKYIADIRTQGGTKEQNDTLASTLNGLKGLGAMMGGQEPAVGEFLNAIEITSGQDFVRIYASVSEDVMSKLGQAAEAKMGDLVKGKKEEPKPEEKK
jgi:hypothetical protein